MKIRVKICPVCKEPMNNEGDGWYCDNPECPTNDFSYKDEVCSQ